MSATPDPSDFREIWNMRYRESQFAFGTEPNEFLESLQDRLPAQGNALCLAEGQGRNAVWLAGRGLQVTAVDLSDVGLMGASELAAARGVTLTTEQADLGNYAIAPGSWDVIISIFGHLPGNVRRAVHRKVVAGLRPNGIYILEAYTPAQIPRGTGGPKDPDLCVTAALLREELEGLEFVLLEERVRAVHEGTRHTGDADVVQLLARKLDG